MKKIYSIISVSITLLIAYSVFVYTKPIYEQIDVSPAWLTSSESDHGSVEDCFDMNPETILRSANINPAFVRLDYEDPIKVDSIAVLAGELICPEVDKSIWWLEAADTPNDLISKSGSYILMIPKGDEIGGEWVGKKNAISEKKKIWKINFQRTVGCDHVHIIDVALFSVKEDESPVIRKYNLGSEIKANNIITVSTGGKPCPEIFDDNKNSAYTMGDDAKGYLFMTFNPKVNFTKIRMYPKAACKWYLEVADNFYDLEDKKNTYQVFTEHDATAGKWDSISFDSSIKNRHWKLWFAKESANISIGEIELYTDEPLDSLSGLQKNLELWEGWRWDNMQASLLYKGNVNVNKNQIYWSSSNTAVATVDNDGKIKALKNGSAFIIAKYKNSTCSTSVSVLKPVKEIEKETLNTFMANPAENYIYEVPVVVVQYIPTTDGVNKNNSYSPEYYDTANHTINNIKEKYLENIQRMKFALEEGSRFRKYKNPNAVPSIGIKVVDYITIYEPYPPGVRNNIYDNGILAYSIDFDRMFEQINFKDYVENHGVKYLIIMGNGGNAYMPNFNPDLMKVEGFRSCFESYMATPGSHQACNGGNPEELPKYDKTYTVISNYMAFPTFNSNNFEPFSHQFERLWMHQNTLQDGSDNFFWQKFVGKIGRCGWTHTPPNTEINYGYFHYIQEDTTQVKPTLCDIEDWKPDNSGEKTLISHHSWEDIEYDWPDGVKEFDGRYELQWFMYWFQSIPGYENNIPYDYNGTNFRMSNWWKFIYDWDKYTEVETGLWEEVPGGVINNKSEDSDFILYPNPNEGFFNLYSNISSGILYDMTITNSEGKALFNEHNKTTGQTQTIDLSKYSAGVYHVTIKCAGREYIKKLIKE